MVEGAACNSFCNGLEPETRQLLCSNRVVIKQKFKQVVLNNQNDAQVGIMIEGMLLVYNLFEDGTEIPVILEQSGDVIAIPQLFREAGYNGNEDYCIFALSDVKICTFPANFIKSLILKDSVFALKLLENLSKQFMRNNSFWLNMHSKSAEEKVIYVLNLLKDSGINVNSLTQEEIALISGVNRVTVTRTMHKYYDSFSY